MRKFLKTALIAQTHPYLHAFDACTKANECDREYIWQTNLKLAGNIGAKMQGGKHPLDSLLFLRIQKTGSSTFESYLKAWGYPHVTHLDFLTVQMMKAQFPQSRVVTLFREPVERALSEYVFRAGNQKACCSVTWDFSKSCGHEIGLKWHKDLETYYTSPCGVVRNRQTAMLVGFPRRHDKPDKGKVRVTADVPFDWDKDGEKLLEIAKKNLLLLDGFGIADCYTDSVAALTKEFSLKLPNVTHGKRPKKKQTPTTKNFAERDRAKSVDERARGWRHFVNDQAREKVRELNKYDVALYEYAVQQFEKKYGVKCNRGF